jgi:hypothetical protein
VPEIWGALATVHPWMPLSHTLGHLEDRRHWIALVVVAVIGLPAYDPCIPAGILVGLDAAWPSVPSDPWGTLHAGD